MSAVRKWPQPLSFALKKRQEKVIGRTARVPSPTIEVVSLRSSGRKVKKLTSKARRAWSNDSLLDRGTTHLQRKLRASRFCLFSRGKRNVGLRNQRMHGTDACGKKAGRGQRSVFAGKRIGVIGGRRHRFSDAGGRGKRAKSGEPQKKET